MWAQIGVWLHIVAGLGFGIRVLMRPRLEPSVRLAWILVIESLPLVGIVAYLFFGEIRMNRRERQRRADIRARLTGLRGPEAVALAEVPPFAQPVLAANRAAGGFRALAGNAVHLLPEDDGAIDELVAAIDAAVDHVHLLFYIWLPDRSGVRVAQAAARAAARGVTVRVLVDALGSRGFMRSPHWAALRRAGALCHGAGAIRLPLVQALIQRIDLRNHRKIVVIDHAIGMTGSRNCADAAFAVKPRFAPWIDVMLRVEGPVVHQMQGVFLQDWMSATGEDLGPMLTRDPPAPAGTGIAQVVATGPDVRRGSLADCMATMIHGARRSITISTPYYVPVPALDAAIRGAALRGVRVTMILPARNDSLLVGATSEGFFWGLAQAGVRLMLFGPGLLHAKIITVDGCMAMVGSANLDRRSFELNYEMNLMIVDQATTAELDRRQQSYVARARPLRLAAIRRWTPWRRLRNNLLALASPLL
ncbi:cardiolipin synthase [Paracoccus luteus]|uniref:cardiolipin synthase n=1 Tax=Paracoccus luteus TaxID=2508543 RepID=UPI00106F7E03|nr:cardiolipin synthase [Paracoccus luteus]